MALRSQRFIFATMIIASLLLILNIFEIHNSPDTIQYIQYNMNIEYSTAAMKEVADGLEADPVLEMNRLRTVPFASWISIPNFYIKRGQRSLRFMNEKLLTLCSICSSNILHQARILATNYKSGPLSFAVYIDEDISYHTIAIENYLHSLFDEYFANLSNPYDIYVGLVYINKSHHFWHQLKFDNFTEMAWKIPVNAMRNLAEYQVPTQWLMTVDIDFEFYSWSVNNAMFLYAILNHAATSHPDRTLFIVPSFAMNSSYIQTNPGYNYNNLTRAELYQLVPQQIEPFYANQIYQECTDYSRWYLSAKDYQLNFSECNGRYEPFFIINSNVSRTFPWDSFFTGRQLDKIQRMQYLRYHGFDGIVLRNMFMIHVNRPHIFQNASRILEIYKAHINNYLLMKEDYCIDDGPPRCAYSYNQRNDDDNDDHDAAAKEEVKEEKKSLDVFDLGPDPFGYKKYLRMQNAQRYEAAAKVPKVNNPFRDLTKLKRKERRKKYAESLLKLHKH